MCGIAGIFDPRSEVDSTIVRDMQARMHHRGPDGEGFFARQGLAMAMRRLAIIDRAGGGQPVFNESGDIVVVYNGEIYNHRELRRELEAKGHRFKSHVDTEVIVHLYEEFGVECVAKLDGMFAFSLWDEKRQRLLIARDRFGVKPLYFAEDRGRIAWASEINSLLEDPTIPRDMDWEAMEIYLALYYIPSPWTIYRSIRALRPAHYMVVTAGGIETKRFWSPPYGTCDVPPEKLEEEIRARLDQAVKMTLESEVPLGIFLSGGLDSTAIAASAKSALGSVRTYSLGFDDDPSYDERPLARTVAHMYETEHHEFTLGHDEMPTILKRLVDVYGQPFGDWSAVVNYKLAMEAKKTSTVVLRGDGGDELFGGYPTLVASRYAEKYLMLPAMMRNAIRGCVERLPSSELYMSTEYKMKRFVSGVRRPVEVAHLAWKEIFSAEKRNALCVGLGANSGGERFSGNIFARMAAPLMEEVGKAGLLDRLMYLDLRVFLEGCGLITSDHVAMAHSIETRVPFLTNAFADFAFSIPASMKVRGFSTKHILRKAMKSVLPPAVLSAPKRGFVLPGAAWLRGPLRPMAEELIAETPDYINRSEARSVLSDHLAGRRDATRELSALVNLTLWEKRMTPNGCKLVKE